MTESKATRIDQQLVKALAHPIRVYILEALQGRVASPTELSKEADLRLGVVSYHANILARCGCLELVRTRPRRGALEHFFRATPRSFIGHQDWRRVPRSVRGGVTEAAVGTFLDRAAAAVDAGTIDGRDDTTLNWMSISVDETGWREVAEIMDRARRLVVDAHSRSAARLVEGEEIPVVVGFASFESGAAQPPPPAS